MRTHFKFDKECFRFPLGKFITSIVCTEDFRFSNGATVEYQPCFNRFERIQNLVLWYSFEENQYSLKLYCVRNGRFSSNDKDTYYGIRSIGLIHNQGLSYKKKNRIHFFKSRWNIWYICK